MDKKILPFFLLASLMAALAPHAAVAAALDQKAVHAEYEWGNFENVVKKIEAFQKGNPSCSREDSVFIARHLAVVYAANPATLEKGKYWMYQLLKVKPDATLVGMYVSEDIDRIFEKIRVEYGQRETAAADEPPAKAAPAKPDAVAAKPKPSPSKTAAGSPGPKRKGESSDWKTTTLWVTGGAALAAAGAFAYFALSAPEAKQAAPEEVEIPMGKSGP